MISALCAIDTAGVEPMSHAQDVSLHLRADIVTETNQRDLFQRIAPQTEKGLYLVPQVIE
jgi:aspartyl-tRNA(Asn)/glutamyl-tRNA(Gln) amidotransferase subunit C